MKTPFSHHPLSAHPHTIGPPPAILGWLPLYSRHLQALPTPVPDRLSSEGRENLGTALAPSQLPTCFPGLSVMFSPPIPVAPIHISRPPEPQPPPEDASSQSSWLLLCSPASSAQDQGLQCPLLIISCPEEGALPTSDHKAGPVFPGILLQREATQEAETIVEHGVSL